MLDQAAVVEVKRLLDEGRLSQRQIAAATGVSRGTVGSIAAGRRGLFGRGDEAAATEAPRRRRLRRAVRCGGCGIKIAIVPCLVCQARGYAQRHPADATTPPTVRRLRTSAAARLPDQPADRAA